MERSRHCIRYLQTLPHFFLMYFLLDDLISLTPVCVCVCVCLFVCFIYNVGITMSSYLYNIVWAKRMNIAVPDINTYYSMVEIAEGKQKKTKHSCLLEYLIHFKCMILVETCRKENYKWCIIQGKLLLISPQTLFCKMIYENIYLLDVGWTRVARNHKTCSKIKATLNINHFDGGRKWSVLPNGACSPEWGNITCTLIFNLYGIFFCFQRHEGGG